MRQACLGRAEGDRARLRRLAGLAHRDWWRGSLLVAPGGNVQAEAQVGQLKIHGKFTGDVAASERVELSNTSQVNGTLVAPAIVLQDGAVFNGMIEIDRRSAAKG